MKWKILMVVVSFITCTLVLCGAYVYLCFRDLFYEDVDAEETNEEREAFERDLCSLWHDDQKDALKKN